MIPCTLVNSLWQLSGTLEARRFEAAIRRPEEAQEELLRELLHRNGDTRFGREHGFSSVRSVADYRARVPLRSYEEFVPWIERIRRGERGVLTVEPVTRLLPTGGSSGGRKLIPWTPSLGAEFRRALAPWIVDLFRRQPDLKRGPAYWSVSPAVDSGEAVSDGEDSPIPIGFDGDSRYLGGPLATLVRPTMAVPESVARHSHVETFQYATLLHLLRCRALRLVSVWHPTFFGLLLDRMVRWWDRLVDDVAGGRGGAPRGRTDPEPAFGALTPDPVRAHELRRVGPQALERIWPHLGLISCWTDAGAGPSARELRERIPHVPMQAKGLMATEGFSSIPFRDGRPLAVRSHFFEFLDEEDRLHLAHELVEGRMYALVLSTSGGLYRYRTGDRVQVDGRVAGTPSIRFVGRTDRVSDLRGEKLTDGFVQQVLDRLFGEEDGVRFAMLAPAQGGAAGPAPAGYTLFVEAPPAVARSCGDRLDALLGENPQYRWARKVGQLVPPRVFLVREGAQRMYMEAQAARGRRLGDVKPVALDSRGDWQSVFEEAGVLIDAS